METRHEQRQNVKCKTFRTILGRNSLKNKRKRKQQKTGMNLKYTEKRERKKFSLKSKRICYYFEEFNTEDTEMRKAL